MFDTLLLLTVATVVMVFAVLVATRWSPWARVAQLEWLAGELGGTAAPTDPQGFAGSLNGYEVNGALGGQDVKIRFSDGHETGSQTSFRVAIANPVEGLWIKPTDMFDRLGFWLGVKREVQTGDQRLDDKYMFSGSQASLKKLLQEGEVETSLDRLFGQHGMSAITLDAGGLSCTRPQARVNGRELLEVLRCLARVAQVCERVRIRVEALGDRFAWTGGGSRALCPYCRDQIDPETLELTACPRCDTVHHQPCYEEAGGCVVFGCQGQERRAGRAREA